VMPRACCRSCSALCRMRGQMEIGGHGLAAMCHTQVGASLGSMAAADILVAQSHVQHDND
jgi:hypothetical protein